MMTLFRTRRIRYKRVGLILAGMAAMSTISFNCAPSAGFKSADYSYLYRNLGDLSDLFEAPKDSPYALQNTFQVFSTMSNVTGQNLAITQNQRSEYDARTGALSQTDKLTDVNPPLQMGTTSLAGEFCNALIGKESAAGATRVYFQNVNFSANLAGNSTNAFAGSIAAMARGFWGRDLKSEEYAALTSYYNDFVSTAGTQTAQTRNLYLSTCAGMLSSLDAITF